MRRCRFSNHPVVRVNAATMGDDAPSLELGDVDADVGMELVLEKLKLLNYETEFCAKRKPPWPRLTRATFAIAENSSSDRDARFHHYAALAAFLVQLCGRRGHLAPGEGDDQKTSAAAILHECAKLGFDPPEFSPSALTRASGKEAVGVLNGLCDLALERAMPRLRRPKHAKEDPPEMATYEAHEGAFESGGEGARLGRGAFADDDAENDDDDASDSDASEEAYIVAGAAPKSPGSFGADAASHAKTLEEIEDARAIESHVDAAAWKLELERVAPQLRVVAAADAKDWRAHLESAREHRRSIAGTFPDVRVMLDGVVKDVAAALEKIETREAYVNAQLAPLADEYRTRREKLDETQRAYDAASEATSSMTNELARLTEELEKVKGVIDDRGENNADATPLNTMKENMEKMREEIKVFEVRVAVCRSALLKHEVRRQAAIVAGKKAGGKKKRRPGADDDTPY